MLDLIVNNAVKMQVLVSDEQAQKLLTFATLIEKWNKTYNLTAIKGLREIVEKHILDSLSIVNYIKPTSLLDVGSGAGLPSIVLAIMIPDLQVVAIDSVGKKTRFMQFVKTTLQLDNFSSVCDRVESFEGQKFAQITSRAFATIDDNINLSRHLLNDDGSFLLMKGKNWKAENSSYLANSKYEIAELNVPFVSEERFLLKIIF